MKPGRDDLPAASMTRVAGASMRGAMRTMVSPRTREVAEVPRAAGAVDDAAVADDEIEGRRLRARRGDRTAASDAAARTEAMMARMRRSIRRRAKG